MYINKQINVKIPRLPIYVKYNHSSTNNTPTFINTRKNLEMTHHNSNRIKYIPTITLKQEDECIIPTKMTQVCDVESSSIMCYVESSPIMCDGIVSYDVQCGILSYDVK